MDGLLSPTLPPGVRDFPPRVLRQRQYIKQILVDTFQRYGFDPLQTPALEHLATLQGKYGEEGEQLLFKILNSGDFWAKVPPGTSLSSHTLATYLTNKGLRYDLTVPLARYVAANRHRLTFPFRRYQVQPVWRADRPQYGRFREFEQCDVDIVGSTSLLCEAELLTLVSEAFTHLGLPLCRIRINHRQLLQTVAQHVGFSKHAILLYQALDTWDKVGEAAVFARLNRHGLTTAQTQQLATLLAPQANAQETLMHLRTHLGEIPSIQELQNTLSYAIQLGAKPEQLVVDTTLARGLTYYTGTIMEATLPQSNLGSLGGGGRYDELTAIFGLKDTSGIGFSFGIDRLYAALEQSNKLPTQHPQALQVMIAHVQEELLPVYLQYLRALREAGIPSLLYPTAAKLSKQLAHANKLVVPYVLLVGDEEHQKQRVGLKVMATGEQTTYTWEALLQRVQEKTI